MFMTNKDLKPNQYSNVLLFIDQCID